MKNHVSTQPLSQAPWPRYAVDAVVWESLIDGLAAETLTLMGLWAEAPNGGQAQVHMCLLNASTHDIAIASLTVTDGKFPSVARKHLPALRMERSIQDYFGLQAQGIPDPRPWVDHGKWPMQHPLADVPSAAATVAQDYKFLPVEGEGIHEIPVGPIHAGIIEPGHFRFSCNGEIVVRLEQRLGYVHKGIEKLFMGADIEQGAKLAGRISGDSTVAYAFAYARAVETATGTIPPARAVMLRGLMAELERIANHLGDIGGICNDAAYALMLAHTGILREETLQLSDACFGHRLMMDRIVPGGVTTDIDGAAETRILAWIDRTEAQFNKLMTLYDDTSSLKDRTNNTGVSTARLVKKFGAGGFVGRASGRHFDARQQVPYAPYDNLKFDVTVLHPGDVNARLWVRRCDILQSFRMIEQMLEQMPSGPISVPLSAAGNGEGAALVEGFRGDVLVWLRLDGKGKIARCYPRDPSWFQWPLLEACIEGNIVADFPLCNKSFNCSYSGHDL